jgi:hypothetical protein
MQRTAAHQDIVYNQEYLSAQQRTRISFTTRKFLSAQQRTRILFTQVNSAVHSSTPGHRHAAHSSAPGYRLQPGISQRTAAHQDIVFNQEISQRTAAHQDIVYASKLCSAQQHTRTQACSAQQRTRISFTTRNLSAHSSAPGYCFQPGNFSAHSSAPGYCLRK